MSELVRALLDSIAAGRPDPLLGHYDSGCVLESHLGVTRATSYGPGGVEGGWRLLVGPPARVESHEVLAAPDGCEVDVLLRDADGGSARHLHRLHHDGAGKIHSHVVHPVRPRATRPPELPAELDIDPGTVEPHPGLGFSGAALFSARTTAGRPVVLKHVGHDDWMQRATRGAGREAALLRAGVFDRLPPTLSCPVRSAAEVPGGCLLVMDDVSEQCERLSQSVPDQLPTLLTALRDLHRASLEPPVDELCSLADRLSLFGPVRPLRECRGPDFLPKTFTTMWEQFAAHAPGDVVDPVLRVVADPGPLLRGLAEVQPPVLLHGDFQPSNLGVAADGIVALDWGLACWGPPEIDYVWLLANAAWGEDDERLAVEKHWTELTGVGRESRAADLAVVFHAAMGELGFMIAHRVQALQGEPVPSPSTVAWWIDRVRSAFERQSDLVR